MNDKSMWELTLKLVTVFLLEQIIVGVLSTSELEMSNLSGGLDLLGGAVQVVVGIGILGESNALLVLHTSIKGSRAGLVGLSVDLSGKSIGRVGSPDMV